MTELEVFDLIMSYFPHRKDDESLIIGGDCYGLPYIALDSIMIRFIDQNDPRDVGSMINLVNDFYDNKLGLENRILTDTYKEKTRTSSCVEAFSFILSDALSTLYPEDHLKPKFKFNKNALNKVNDELQKDNRFNKVLFG